LWKSLRERADKQTIYQIDIPEDIDPAMLMALLGIKDLKGDYVESEDER
jgi:hypothetical protein